MVPMIVLGIAVILMTAAAAVTDWRMHRIPNYITVPAAVTGVLYHGFFPTGEGWLFALGGFGVGFALLLLPWIFGGGGMGDVKLLAALGSWLGPFYVLIAFAVSAFVGSFLALMTVLAGGLTAVKRETSAAEVDASAKPRKALPFAIPLALGSWLVLAWLALRGGF
ncbi:hypothetical protein JCM19992_10590 [Thermostilla marina]